MACNINAHSPIYTNKRYVTFIIISIISLVLPFIRINGNHLFLLDFDQKQLNLFFTSFDMQQLYLMPFLLIMLFLGVFFMTTLGGRIWCGWSCPQTIFRTIYRDLIETKLLKLRRSPNNKQKDSKKGQYIKKSLAVIIWSALSLIAASNFIWYFVPPETFFKYIQDPANHMVLFGFVIVLALFLVYDVIFIKENFCIYICPYAKVQSVMFDDDTILPIYSEKRGGKIYDEHGTKLWSKPPGDTDECTGCEACVRICPAHIDIRKGMQLECINCLECADACVPIMAKFDKPSLISWQSTDAEEKGIKTRYVRFRTVAYGIALISALVALMWMGSKKEHMLLNINRTTRLYKILDDGKTVQNDYIFLFQNTDRNDHKYYIKINNDDIKVIKPSEPFDLEAGKAIKKVVILQTRKKLIDTNEKDTPIPITVKAYAIDDENKSDDISVFRKTVFFYPKGNELKEYKK